MDMEEAIRRSDATLPSYLASEVPTVSTVPAPPETDTLPDAHSASTGATRREFVAGVAMASAGAVIAPLLMGDAASAATIQADTAGSTLTLTIALNINGADHKLTLEPRVTLLDALRERLFLTGTKKGCDHGQCGSCTVLIDGQRKLSCLSLAIMHQNAKITTIEGLQSFERQPEGDTLHPMQAAFIKHDAFQCGYCTPGQIMSAVGLTREEQARKESKQGIKSDDDIQEQMSGNICRCGAYPNIVMAVREVLEGQNSHAPV